MKIPFNVPTLWEKETLFTTELLENGKFSGNNRFSTLCSELISAQCGAEKSFMTNSCSSALELAASLLELNPEDEVIIPSFAFPSTASAFSRNGARIIWAEIRADSCNIDESSLENLITPKTKAVVVVHYGGISCELDEITTLCRKHGLVLIEDCAHSIGASYKNKGLGNLGDLSVFSFHETKNIQCGEGGALVINNPEYLERASILFNRGTDKEMFLKNQIDHYSWIDFSSNFLMSELQSAFLYPQLKNLGIITRKRISDWDEYHWHLSSFLPEERLPFRSQHTQHNGHIFYIKMNDHEERKKLIDHLRKKGIYTTFHYQALHRAPFWKGLYDDMELPVTDKIVETLLRLPIFYSITSEQIVYVVEKIGEFL